MSINNSSFSFREGTISNSDTFEGVKLLSSDFFYANSFNKIKLKEIILQKNGLAMF
jgi:hypothetical protein